MSRTIYSGKSVKEEYSEEQLSQWLYDGLVGAIMGTGLTAVNPETYAFNPGKPQISAEQEKSGLQPPVEGQNQAPQPGTEQKNTAPEEAESTAVNTDPAQHTAVEQAVIDEYQAAVDDHLRVIVEEYKANPNRAFARHTISPVTERQAKDAENLLGGSYSDFTNAINANGIKHILKEHGKRGRYASSQCTSHGNTPETSLASSPPETNISDNSIVQIGEKYNSNPQPSTETGNTGDHSGKGAPFGGRLDECAAKY